jgi:actin-related protein 9
MFNAEKEGEFEPVKIRRRDETDSTHNGHDHTGANGEADENDGWEEDHISEEGAVWPMKHGRIVDWPAFYALMTHVYNTVNPPFHTPVLLISEPVWTPKDLEKVTQFFFERFKVPAFAVMDAAMAATYAYGVPTATVVDVGLEKADITCVSDYVLQHIGRSLAVPDCGGEALTDRLMEVMKGRKGFGRDFCDQLKRSGICEILPSDAEILRPGAGADDGATNPAAVASTGIDGGSGQKVAGSGAAGDVPRGPGPGTEVGEQKLEDEDGVLDIASIVTGGNMQEYLAQKEREKAEKAAAKHKKGSDAQPATAAKPVRQQPNSRRLRNTFMYDDLNLHNAMKKAGMSGQNMSDMHSALGEGPNKRQKTPEPTSAVTEVPADGGLEAAQDSSSGSMFRREIEVGPERFQAASGGILDRLADAVYRTVQSCNDVNRRSDLWDNMIILGNGSRVRGFKDALLARLSEKYIISPSSATIFTSELPSNLSTPIATGANTPMPQMPGQPHPSSSVNPLLVAATTAQNPHFNPTQSAFGHQSNHSHSGHGQTPTSIKFVKFPEYFPEWKEVGYDEAAFLGAQVAAKVLYVTDSANNGYMSRTTYNDQGPSGIHEVAL